MRPQPRRAALEGALADLRIFDDERPRAQDIEHERQTYRAEYLS
jgi:hypothetical protein